jgi:hypothetical protein
MKNFYVFPLNLKEPKCGGNCVCDDEACAEKCTTWGSANASMNAVDNSTEKNEEPV